MTERDKTILTLSHAGKSRRAIGRQLGLSHTAVTKVLRRIAVQQEHAAVLQSLWLTGWEWSQARFPVSLGEVHAMGAQLKAAVEALRQRGGNSESCQRRQ